MREQDRRQRATGRGQWRWRSREDDNGAWSRGQVVSVCRALPLPHLSCACAAAQVEFHQGDDGARVYSLVYRHRGTGQEDGGWTGHSIPWLRCYCLLPPRRVAPPPSLLTSHSFLLPLFPCSLEAGRVPAGMRRGKRLLPASPCPASVEKRPHTCCIKRLLYAPPVLPCMCCCMTRAWWVLREEQVAAADHDIAAPTAVRTQAHHPTGGRHHQGRRSVGQGRLAQDAFQWSLPPLL
jgi:hypothetical protein